MKPWQRWWLLTKSGTVATVVCGRNTNNERTKAQQPRGQYLVANIFEYPLLKEGLTVGIVTPDLHVPEHDVKAHKAVCNYVEELQPNYWVDLGDFMNYDEISRHVGKNIRTIIGKSLAKSNAMGNKVLDERQAALGEGKYIQIEGNHDKRPEDIINENPVLEGIIEIEKALDFAGRDIDYVRYWTNGDMVKIGKSFFLHGRYVNEFHAKKHVDRYGKNVFFGHTHDIQSYSKVWEGDGETRIGQSLGCLCKYALDYKKASPDKWQQAVTTFYWRPNGLFSYFISPIFNGKFIAPNGKEYTS
jgi:hypothetical protein